MGFLEILLIGIGLSMDACAVSASNGMCYKGLKLKNILVMALSFGVFQGIMPLIGYYAGTLFSKQVSAIDHWVALVLLGFIGAKMLWDGFHHDSECPLKPFSYKLLLVQALATSIDALAVGISFAAVDTNIFVAVSAIALTTFVLSTGAVWVGKKVGDKLNSKAEIFGGIILIAIGLKIFLEHTLQ